MHPQLLIREFAEVGMEVMEKYCKLIVIRLDLESGSESRARYSLAVITPLKCNDVKTFISYKFSQIHQLRR